MFYLAHIKLSFDLAATQTQNKGVPPREPRIDVLSQIAERDNNLQG